MLSHQRPSRPESGLARFRVFIALFVLSAMMLPVSAATEQSAIQLDGLVTEEAWKNARVLESFKQVAPIYHGDEPERTELRIISQPDGLYVSFVNYQARETRVIRTWNRDGDMISDFNQIMVDIEGDTASAFEFSLGITGSQKDAKWIAERNRDINWDGVWFGETSQHEDRWESEIFIPWSTLKFSTVKGATRDIRVMATRFWQGLPMFANMPGGFFDRDPFLSLMVPYTIDNYSPQDLRLGYSLVAGNDAASSTNQTSRVTGELNWRTGNHQLAVALFPDYGQIEADDLVVNFSSLETFFPEARPFFTATSDVLTVRGPDFRLFHTRRIGGSPDYDCDSLPSQSEIDRCDDASVPLARVDFLANWQMTTKNVDMLVLTGVEEDLDYSPGRTFSTVRTRYRGDDVRVGFIATHVDNPTTGEGPSSFAVDTEWRPIDALQLQVVAMHSDTDTSDQGHSAVLSWQPVSAWNLRFEHQRFGADLDLSDAGFLRRSDYVRTHMEADWRTVGERGGDSKLLGISGRIWAGARSNTSGLSLREYLGSRVRFSYEKIRLGGFINLRSSGADDVIAQTDLVDYITTGSNHEMGAFIEDEGSERLRWSSSIKFATNDQFLPSGTRIEVDGRLEFLLDSVRTGFWAQYLDHPNWVIWDELVGTQPRLIAYNRRQTNLNTWVTWVPSLKHELRFRLQQVLLLGRAPRGYTVQGTSGALVPASNFTAPPLDYAEANLQLRYRYEPNARSELYVIYQRSGSSRFEEFNLTPDFALRDVWSNPDNDLVAIKYSASF